MPASRDFILGSDFTCSSSLVKSTIQEWLEIIFLEADEEKKFEVLFVHVWDHFHAFSVLQDSLVVSLLQKDFIQLALSQA